MAAQQVHPARWNSSSGPASAAATSPRPRRTRRPGGSPAPRPVRDPHAARGPRVSATARCRNAAAAARPPRACARPAERSSSKATCSSGPAAAAARCHARRSGSVSRSVASASARWTARRSSTAADSVHGGAHQRMTEGHALADRQQPVGFRRPTAETAIPSRSAARATAADRRPAPPRQAATDAARHQRARRVAERSSPRSVPRDPARPAARTHPPAASPSTLAAARATRADCPASPR